MLAEAAETQAEIAIIREQYRAAAIRASIVYFVLFDLAYVDPMYMFSLDSYNALYLKSIADSRVAGVEGEPELTAGERCAVINSHHTLATYRYVCKGLFERHKLLYSLLLTTRIMMNDGKIPKPEIDFVYFGGVVLDRKGQRKNPAPEWLNEVTWDNATELDKLEAFSGFASSIENNKKDWQVWFMAEQPEEMPMPDGFSDKLNELQRVAVMRAMRSDRVLFAASAVSLQSLFFSRVPFCVNSLTPLPPPSHTVRGGKPRPLVCRPSGLRPHEGHRGVHAERAAHLHIEPGRGPDQAGVGRGQRARHRLSELRPRPRPGTRGRWDDRGRPRPRQLGLPRQLPPHGGVAAGAREDRRRLLPRDPARAVPAVAVGEPHAGVSDGAAAAG